MACPLVKHLKGLKHLCSGAPRPALERELVPSKVKAAVITYLTHAECQALLHKLPGICAKADRRSYFTEEKLTSEVRHSNAVPRATELVTEPGQPRPSTSHLSRVFPLFHFPLLPC